ncbi:hypothetical protein DdX_20864 [Ditylenchus destructor]|uniref:Uncharacterized protein n=1 Tax=Ditylenchus destructor TaxID=166010 RepID=A0AAD4MGG6_9BILA|nr:hypothetical protein DdX_20864 [Ditylenchus destructor]
MPYIILCSGTALLSRTVRREQSGECEPSLLADMRTRDLFAQMVFAIIYQSNSLPDVIATKTSKSGYIQLSQSE